MFKTLISKIRPAHASAPALDQSPAQRPIVVIDRDGPAKITAAIEHGDLASARTLLGHLRSNLEDMKKQDPSGLPIIESAIANLDAAIESASACEETANTAMHNVLADPNAGHPTRH
ncbi:hypothetical protein [Paraburkholderia sp. C35]|uniref:hypothetical protein n=1 Tax=Paraburkholderia sp. C35 TaxID=2126993 RepID=UPI000D69EEDA|nr:hypothetical protein [Paraburkholderia sp. C35]